jgi:hypothetical protein
MDLHVKYSLFLSYFNLEPSDRLSKNTQTRNFINIHPLGAELFRADERKHRARRDEANSLFSQFRERP